MDQWDNIKLPIWIYTKMRTSNKPTAYGKVWKRKSCPWHMLVNPHGTVNVGPTRGKIVKQAKTMRVNLHIPVNAGTHAMHMLLLVGHGSKSFLHTETHFSWWHVCGHKRSVDTPSKIHRESDCKSKSYHGSEFGGWLNEGTHLCNLAIQVWHQRAKEFLYQQDTVPKNGGTTPTMAGGEGGHLVAGK